MLKLEICYTFIYLLNTESRQLNKLSFHFSRLQSSISWPYLIGPLLTHQSYPEVSMATDPINSNVNSGWSEGGQHDKTKKGAATCRVWLGARIPHLRQASWLPCLAVRDARTVLKPTECFTPKSWRLISVFLKCYFKILPHQNILRCICRFLSRPLLH